MSKKTPKSPPPVGSDSAVKNPWARAVYNQLVTYLDLLISEGPEDILFESNRLLGVYSQDANSDGAKIRSIGRARALKMDAGFNGREKYVPADPQARALVICYVTGLAEGLEDYLQIPR